MTKTTRHKIITFAAAGTIFEYYDLGLIGFLSVLFGKLFFPVNDPLLSTIATMGTFAVAYLARPVGAVFFGHLGDRYGRKKALTLSLSIVSFPTIIIGFLPSYQSIGILAPVILVLCRLLQGLGVGGEYNGSAIFYLEHETEVSRRGFYSSLLSTAGLMGFLLASITAYIVTLPELPESTWRVAFFLGSFIAIIGLYIRRRFSETPEFLTLQKTNNIDQLPIKSIFADHKLKCLAIFGLGATVSSLSLSLIGMSGFLTKVVGVEHDIALSTNVLGIMTYALFTPFAGRMADKFTPLAVMKFVAVATIVVSPFIFFLLGQKTFTCLLTGQVLLGLLAGGMLGPSHLLTFKIFEAKNRYTAVAFNFSLGLAIFGGCAPLMMSLLAFETTPIIGPVLYLYMVMFASLANFYLIAKLMKSKAPTTTLEGAYQGTPA